jgi:hypothetical protein
MSGFAGRGGPNVSRYIANLNTIPTAQDLASQEQWNIDNEFNDLDIFAEGNFFDFDKVDSDETKPVEGGQKRESSAVNETVDGLNFTDGMRQSRRCAPRNIY